MASTSIQQWAILLSDYHYCIEYKPGQQNANSNAFSRLPLSTTPQKVPTLPEVIHMMELIALFQFPKSRYKPAHNPKLSRVKEFVMNGWIATHILSPDVQ